MARTVRVVIDDADKAHAFELRKYTDAFRRTGARHDKAERHAREAVGAVRAKGTVHAHADLDCPEGLPNCRNCGDPAFRETCLAAGHCPDCGTKHGVAPDSVLVAHGMVLEG